MLSFLFRTPLQKALALVRKSGESWYSASLTYCGFSPKISTLPEAKDVVAVLAEVERNPDRFKDPQGIGFLSESFANDAVRQYLVEHAQPILVRLALRPALSHDLSLSCLRSLVSLGDGVGIETFCRAAQEGIHAGEDQWGVIFGMLPGLEGVRESVVEHLSGKTLPSVLQREFLGLVNTLCREHGLAQNPFDDEQGVALLRHMLTDPALPGIGVEVAANLPFLNHPAKSELLSICSAHQERNVRLEAAWALAKMGDRSGIQRLVQECADPLHAFRPIAYLKELGAVQELPPEWRDPRHLALVEMAHWLSHEMEYGELPAELSLLDDRILIWPPDRQQYRCFLIRYRYPAKTPADQDRVGIGMVGATTFSLSGNTVITAGMTMEQIYAAYCSWQLGIKDQQTGTYSITQGLARIAESNPGFGEPATA